MKISICQIQAYYIPTYLDFSHADLEYADFSQSKKNAYAKDLLYYHYYANTI